MSVALPVDAGLQNFKGFLLVSGIDYGIEIKLCGAGQAAVVLLSPDLASLLHGLEKVVESKAKSCGDDVGELVSELTDLCERVVGEAVHSMKRTKRAAPVDGAFFSRLVAEIQSDGLDIVDISEQMDEVKLRATDAAGVVIFLSLLF